MKKILAFVSLMAMSTAANAWIPFYWDLPGDANQGYGYEPVSIGVSTTDAWIPADWYIDSGDTGHLSVLK